MLSELFLALQSGRSCFLRLDGASRRRIYFFDIDGSRANSLELAHYFRADCPYLYTHITCAFLYIAFY